MDSKENPWGGGAAGADKPKLTKRFSEKFSQSKKAASVGFTKTKAAASIGFAKSKVVARKVKSGATVGVNWIKLRSQVFQKR